MDNISWKSWLFRACVDIRFKPDRGAVEKELLAHLEDKAEAIRQQADLPVYVVEKQALAAMGDPDEVGRQLAAVHKPWLGYLWLWSRRVLILCIVVMIWAAFGFSGQVFRSTAGDHWWQDISGYSGDQANYTITEFSPDCTGQSDGYTFTVPAAAVIHNEAFLAREEVEGETYEYAVEENTALYLTMRATHLTPSTESCAAFRSFYAVDDLGNHYWSMNDPDVIYTWQMERSLRGNYFRNGLWTSDYKAWIVSIDPAAEWIELRYDRDGRDVRLRIDLTGGESQ